MKNQKWYWLYFYYGLFFVAITAVLVCISAKDSKDTGKNKVVSSEKSAPVTSSYQKEKTSKKSTKVAECVSAGCTNKPMSGSIFCETHDVKTKEKSSVKDSKNTTKKSNKKKTSYSSKKKYDPYDVYEFDDPDDFAEEWAEEFGDGDWDGGYDDAYDYWEDEYE